MIADVHALIAENNQLVAEIHDLDERMAGIMYTPRLLRKERHEQLKRQRAGKIARQKLLVAEIKRIAPHAEPE